MKNYRIIFLFVFVVIFMFSAIVLSGFWKDKTTVSRVELTGNTTLSKEEIFDFAKLSDSLIFSNSLTMEMIEGRIGKHPNIKNADVSRDGHVIKINISEKNPFAVATNGKDMFLADDQLSLYPMKKEHRDIDLPVVSGLSGELGSNTFGKDDFSNLKTAQYIISQSVRINKSLYNYISEISFADTNQVVLVTNDDAAVLYFIDYSSLLGAEKYRTLSQVKDIASSSLRKAIAEKLIQLDGFLKQVRLYRSPDSFTYIDMRFDGMVVVKNNNQSIAQ
jgi:cell division septal protein FtsQ